jgi:hypothetical protein
MSAIAFHEKVGRSQVDSLLFSLDKLFSPGRVCGCRHPSIRTLMSDFLLGASWAFSLQPVLPPDCRPALRWEASKLGQAINAVTGTRRFGLLFFLPKNVLL